MFKKKFKVLSYSIFLTLSVLLLLELSYRLYIFDFYKANFRLLNTRELMEADDDRPAILAMGDSFTADPRSYISYLRDSLPGYRIFNAAVPGTTVKQSLLMMKKRIGQVQPQIFLYQIYVGNDLFEFRHPASGGQVSAIRKCYWWLADRFLVLGFINSRLPQVRNAIAGDVPVDYDPKELESYSADNYSSRTKMQFSAEPGMLENAILLKGKRAADMKDYIGQLNELIDELPEQTKILLLVIPHCVQVSPEYSERMTAIGARISSPQQLLQRQYPFIQQLSEGLKNPKVKIINPLLLLQSAEFIEPVYFGNDPHLSPYGQQVLGRFLLNVIDKE